MPHGRVAKRSELARDVQLGGRLNRHSVTIVVDRGETELALPLRALLEELGQPALRFVEGGVASEDVTVFGCDNL